MGLLGKLPIFKGSGLLLKIAPFAIAAGLIYYFVLRPAGDALAAPGKAIADASKAIGESVEATQEFAEDLGTAITTPESFSRPPGEGGDFQESIFGFGASIQRVLTGGLTWREEDVLDSKTNIQALSSLIYDIDLVAPRPEADSGTVNETNALNLQNTFSDQAIAERLTNTIRNTIEGNYSDPFGGYGSAVNQEVELRRAIEESKARYGEWFK